MLRVTTDIFEQNQAYFLLLSNSLCLHDGTQKTIINSETSANTISSQEMYRGHYSPLFGIICGLHQFNLHDTKIMYLRCVLRDAVSAACRLNILGPIEGAKLQIKFSQKLENTLKITNIKTIPSEKSLLISNEILKYLKPKNVQHINDEQMYKKNKIEKITTAPILELIQTQHEQLYSRLFIS